MASENILTLEEFRTTLNYLLDNNKRLVEEGQTPIAVGIESEAGIGKTSIIQQVAQERGMTYTQINLAEFEEVGDLTGFPIKEFYVRKGTGPDAKGGWVTEEVLESFIAKGYAPTRKTRMSYASPAWLPTEENPNGGILCLDDYTRGTQNFMQCCMELINKGKYSSWKLPENTTIVLSSNPDNGEYAVSSLDEAQRTRFVNFMTKFDLNVWARWAEKTDLDSRVINFALFYPEIFAKNNGVKIMNPRSYTTFCKAISGLKDWSVTASRVMIYNIAKGCFPNDKDNMIGNMFDKFLKFKYDKLVTPAELLKESWDKVYLKAKNSVYPDGNRSNAISSVMATRFLNYCLSYFEQANSDTKKVIDRLVTLTNSDIFTRDQILFIVKTLATQNRTRGNAFYTNPVLSKMLV